MPDDNLHYYWTEELFTGIKLLVDRPATQSYDLPSGQCGTHEPTGVPSRNIP